MFLRAIQILGGVVVNKIDDKVLDDVYGGSTSLTGTLLNAFNEVIKTLYDVGHAVGSSIRRVVSGELCPFE